jgi:hypothetical protein
VKRFAALAGATLAAVWVLMWIRATQRETAQQKPSLTAMRDMWVEPTVTWNSGTWTQ